MAPEPQKWTTLLYTYEYIKTFVFVFMCFERIGVMHTTDNASVESSGLELIKKE